MQSQTTEILLSALILCVPVLKISKINIWKLNIHVRNGDVRKNYKYENWGRDTDCSWYLCVFEEWVFFKDDWDKTQVFWKLN